MKSEQLAFRNVRRRALVDLFNAMQLHFATAAFSPRDADPTIDFDLPRPIVEAVFGPIAWDRVDARSGDRYVGFDPADPLAPLDALHRQDARFENDPDAIAPPFPPALPSLRQTVEALVEQLGDHPTRSEAAEIHRGMLEGIRRESGQLEAAVTANAKRVDSELIELREMVGELAFMIGATPETDFVRGCSRALYDAKIAYVASRDTSDEYVPEPPIDAETESEG